MPRLLKTMVARVSASTFEKRGAATGLKCWCRNTGGRAGRALLPTLVGLVAIQLLAWPFAWTGAAHGAGTAPGERITEQQLRALDTPANRLMFSDRPQSLQLQPVPNISPPVLKVRRDGKLVGLLFSTYLVSGTLGFSGKPIDIHVALGRNGKIIGARMVRHQEPILVLGITPKALNDYVSGFRGFDIRTRLVVGKPSPGLPDGVSGASVSSGVIRNAIIRSARNVALAHEIFAAGNVKARLDRTTFKEKSWEALVKERAVVHRRLSLAQVNAAFGAPPGDNGDGTFIDLYVALATPPTIGRNLLKRLTYEELVAAGAVGDNLILIGANGLYSFRGRAWRRSGVFDRIEIVQGARTFRLTKAGYRLLERLRPAEAPSLRELAAFVIPAKSGFDPTRPWRLNLLVARSGGDRSAVLQLKTFAVEYRLPDAYIIGGRNSRQEQLTPDQTNPPIWLEYWEAQKPRIAILLLLLFALTGILFFQDALARRKPLYLMLRGGFLLVTLLFLGFYAGAQLSVLNVITFIHSLMGGFKWDLFLLNPLVFILWGFVAVALLFWGRGVYCGWLCPFGALQELVNMAARRLGIRQIKVPWGLHERLWPIKYTAFLAILAISLSSMTWAFELAEIEPFKTVIILKFMREWPFVLYPVLLLTAGLFIERFYCRYLCPLGAALAIPARLRMFEWLKRRHQCGHECNICAVRCTVQAIHPMGQINPNECIYCLRCQVKYYDETTCRALKDRARRRRARQGASTNTNRTTTLVDTPVRPAKPPAEISKLEIQDTAEPGGGQ